MNIAVYGTGAMGRLVAELVEVDTNLNLVGMVDSRTEGEKIYASSSEIEERIDGIIDFSHPSNLEEVLGTATKNAIPTLIATTGFSQDQLGEIEEASKDAPIIFTRNTSMGVNLVSEVVKQVTKALGTSFDIEIIEKHHNKKLDSPSGTAKLLYDSVKGASEEEVTAIHGRSGMKKREAQDVGIHAIRGGSIVGEHSVIFAGLDEIVEVKHEALSKKIFAKGALKGISYLNGKENGFYTMKDVLGL